MRWFRKFQVAIQGVAWALRTQSSMHVHIVITIVVVSLATWLRLPTMQWAILLLTISSVIVAEMINSAIEEFVRIMHPDNDVRIGRLLDVSAGAVLIASLIAVLVGVIVFAGPLLAMWKATR